MKAEKLAVVQMLKMANLAKIMSRIKQGDFNSFVV